ncbi:ImmA/IrrE family metallo-endopeptidase [Mycolicibacterium celeriflavum]|uniref:ImmA/IrrE family metallo-endopeptidase n=1 Tax=Mycolicibacterium celeriflavum TaxID=1249101 RepID=UPI003CEEFE44
MALRRGFKAEANSTADEVRGELGLSFRDPLDPLQLAAHLDIPVIGLAQLKNAPQGVEYFTQVEPSAFSAITVFDGRRRLIVHNDGHAPGRRNSNVAHELAHGLLLHPPTPALDDRGCRHWNQDIEDEASWLAGALLVPERTALWIARGRQTPEEAAEEFGVSAQMMRWRLNVTGAGKRAQGGRASSAG